MKIDKVIMSSNDASYYLDFWPYVAKAWRKLLGEQVDVVLGYTGNKDEKIEKHGSVIYFGKRSDIIEKNYSKLIRTISAARYPDSYCLISDIDMLPLNGEYFKNNSNFANDNNIVFYSADQSGIPTKFPICYMLAKGKVFNEVVNPKNLSEEDLFKSWSSVDRYLMKNPSFSDETFYSELFDKWGILKQNSERAIRLKRGWHTTSTYCVAKNRIDRAMWKINIEKLKCGNYIDAHLLRPLNENMSKIKPLFDYLEI